MYRGNQIPVINHSGRNVPTTNIPLTQERLEIKAIQLWSDWNLGLRKWAEEKVKSVIIITCITSVFIFFIYFYQFYCYCYRFLFFFSFFFQVEVFLFFKFYPL